MNRITENTIEQSLIAQLVAQGYSYHYGPDMAPFSDNPQRENFSSVLLENHFKACLKKLNPSIPESALAEAYQKVLNLGREDIKSLCAQNGIMTIWTKALLKVIMTSASDGYQTIH